jgi:hypothetical protein
MTFRDGDECINRSMVLDHIHCPINHNCKQINYSILLNILSLNHHNGRPLRDQ